MADYTFPENLKYTKEHEWVQKVEDGLFRIGVTEYAAGSMGDVTFVELPELEDEIESGDTPCVIETVKSSEDGLRPTSGVCCRCKRNLGRHTGNGQLGLLRKRARVSSRLKQRTTANSKNLMSC